MRPLNRPMFRNGGPIKEGIMTGMKDSPQQLVQPAADGSRPGYAGPAFLAMPYIGAGLRMLARPFGQFVTKQMARKGVTAGSGAGTIRSGLGKSRVLKKGEKLTEDVNKFQPNPFGKYFIDSPEGRFIAGSSGFAGKAGKKVIGATKSLAKSPLTVGSVLYYGGGALLPDGTPDPEDPKNYKPAGEGGKSGAPGGGDPNMFLEPRKKEMTDEERKAAMNKEMDARKKYYYELMGMDKMQKGAVYDTLIDASNQIREGGNIKDQLKSGDLVSGVINALSKNLDKSVDLKKQIDAAILKAEITKDVNREKDQLDAKVKNAQLALYNKKLDGLDLRESIASYYDKNKVMPSGSQLASLARVTEGIDAKVEDTQAVKDWMEENNSNEAGYFETLVKSGNLPAGNYVINNRIFNFDGEKITALL